MTNEEKANDIIIGIPQNPYHITYEEVIENFTTDQLEECLLEMAEWKDSKLKDNFIKFMQWLNKRGFIKEDLCFDIEHQVETFVNQILPQL